MRWTHLLAVGALSVSLAACTTSPTGRSQLTLLSDEQLDQMGAQAFAQYQQELPTVGGAPLRYVQCVTEAVVRALPEQRTKRMSFGAPWILACLSSGFVSVPS